LSAGFPQDPWPPGMNSLAPSVTTRATDPMMV
jgi:hypothetical protein